MKINSPEDIVSAYATMRLLEPICGDEEWIDLRISGTHLEIRVTDEEDTVICFSKTGSLEMIPVFERYRSLAAKLNAALAAPEQNENQ